MSEVIKKSRKASKTSNNTEGGRPNLLVRGDAVFLSG